MLSAHSCMLGMKWWRWSATMAASQQMAVWHGCRSSNRQSSLKRLRMFSQIGLKWLNLQDLLLQSHTAFTLQHLGGMSIVEKVTSGLLSPMDEDTSNVVIDLLGFDGWPASYAMGQLAGGLCGNWVWELGVCNVSSVGIGWLLKVLVHVLFLNAFWGSRQEVGMLNCMPQPHWHCLLCVGGWPESLLDVQKWIAQVARVSMLWKRGARSEEQCQWSSHARLPSLRCSAKWSGHQAEPGGLLVWHWHIPVAGGWLGGGPQQKVQSTWHQAWSIWCGSVRGQQWLGHVCLFLLSFWGDSRCQGLLPTLRRCSHKWVQEDPHR